MPRLVIRKGEGVGKDHALGGECVVGRHASANFVIDDGLMSRRHFRIFQDPTGWMVEDCGSTNGTLLNGTKVGRSLLQDGDVVSAGNTEFVFRQKDLLTAGGAAPIRPPVLPAPPKPPVVAAPKPAAPPAAAQPPAVPAPKPTSAAKPVSAPVPRRKRTT